MYEMYGTPEMPERREKHGRHGRYGRHEKHEKHEMIASVRYGTTGSESLNHSHEK